MEIDQPQGEGSRSEKPENAKGKVSHSPNLQRKQPNDAYSVKVSLEEEEGRKRGLCEKAQSPRGKVPLSCAEGSKEALLKETSRGRYKGEKPKAFFEGGRNAPRMDTRRG